MSNLVSMKKMKKSGKKGGLMPQSAAAGKLMAHLPIGKMGKSAAMQAKMQSKKGY